MNHQIKQSCNCTGSGRNEILLLAPTTRHRKYWAPRPCSAPVPKKQIQFFFIKIHNFPKMQQSYEMFSKRVVQLKSKKYKTLIINSNFLCSKQQSSYKNLLVRSPPRRQRKKRIWLQIALPGAM